MRGAPGSSAGHNQTGGGAVCATRACLGAGHPQKRQMVRKVRGVVIMARTGWGRPVPTLRRLDGRGDGPSPPRAVGVYLEPVPRAVNLAPLSKTLSKTLSIFAHF